MVAGGSGCLFSAFATQRDDLQSSESNKGSKSFYKQPFIRSITTPVAGSQDLLLV
jgi:hypothetical protein